MLSHETNAPIRPQASWNIHAPQQIIEAGIVAHVVEPRGDFSKYQPGSVFLIGMFKPLEG